MLSYQFISQTIFVCSVVRKIKFEIFIYREKDKVFSFEKMSINKCFELNHHVVVVLGVVSIVVVVVPQTHHHQIHRRFNQLITDFTECPYWLPN